MLMEFLMETMESFTIISVIDIIIVAYLIYRVILVLKHTRAMSLIKGIIALALATLLSELLSLDTTHWLLNSVWTVGVLALVIVFQPELRRTLEHLGRGRFLTTTLKFRPDTGIGDAINEIVKAVSILAKNKTGALIVWERETGVGDYMETGVSIDGLIRSELLINIFIPNTPLHDGAVMIRKGRIVAAACYLPLTNNNNLSQSLGTRHRAAIGITEDTDALAIVVSEETGQISLAVNGELIRYLDGSRLGDLLIKYLDDHNEKSLYRIWRGVESE